MRTRMTVIARTARIVTRVRINQGLFGGRIYG